MKTIRYIVAIIAGFSFASDAFAFRDHALLSYYVFSEERNNDESSALRKPVTVESLDKFLESVSKDPTQYLNLQKCFEVIENYSKSKIPGYRPLPNKLKLPFNSATLTKSGFIDAIRVNSSVTGDPYVRSFLQKIDKLPEYKEFSEVSLQNLDVGVYYDDKVEDLPNFAQIPAFDVLCTACDEPDYSQDLNLWQKSPTDSDKYGFGMQPFSAPGPDYLTKTQFHLGFFHESWLMNKVGSSFMQSYIEYRIKQFTTLSAFAFQNNHDYWGWRFLGWGMHYVQDLCQPYHTTIMPGASTAKLAFAGILYKIGISSVAEGYGMLSGKAHSGIELYVYGLLNFGLKASSLNKNASSSKTIDLALKPAKFDCCGHQKNPNSNDVIIRGNECEIRDVLNKLLPSLKNPKKREMPNITLEDYPRKVISADSHALSSDLAAVLQSPTLPADYYSTKAPKSFGDLDKEALYIKNFNNNNCNKVVGKIFENITIYSRFFMKSIVDKNLSIEPKKSSLYFAEDLLYLAKK